MFTTGDSAEFWVAAAWGFDWTWWSGAAGVTIEDIAGAACDVAAEATGVEGWGGWDERCGGSWCTSGVALHSMHAFGVLGRACSAGCCSVYPWVAW